MKRIWTICCLFLVLVAVAQAKQVPNQEAVGRAVMNVQATFEMQQRADALADQIAAAKLTGNVPQALLTEYATLQSQLVGREFPNGESLDQGGENCADAFDLGSVLGANVDFGSTEAAHNDFPFIAGATPPCYQGTYFNGSGDANDVTYKWTAPRTSSYTFSLCGSDYDTEISLWNFTCPTAPVFPTDYICGNDDPAPNRRCPGNNFASVLTCIELTEGQEVLIVVDGFNADSGNYNLSIFDCTPPCEADLNLVAPGTVTANTCEAGNDCGVRITPEVIVAVEIPTAGYWSFFYGSTEFDPFLFIGSTCCSRDICFDDDGGGDFNSLCECVYLEAGTVWVSLEAFEGCGVGSLSVTQCAGLGRCCYTNEAGGPGCGTSSFEECIAIGGTFDEGLNCETDPCQLGRCCYFDDGEPACESGVSSSFCRYALNGEWTEGATCDQPCPSIGDCGPIDLVLAVDVTGSMYGAIDNIVAELPNIIAVANIASGNDLRLGLLTFSDEVSVLHTLTNDLAGVQATISSLTSFGGAAYPEASDEALREVLTGNGLCVALGDFNVAFRPAASKIIVLITDASNGGCDDAHDGSDVVNAHDRALDALGLGVRICSVWRPLAGAEPFGLIQPVLEDYASTTGGTFTVIAPDGSGAGGALNQIVANCGQGDLRLSSNGADLRCDPNGGGITTPTFNVTVTTQNNGTATCANATLTLSNIGGDAGAVVLNSANPVALGDLVPSASVNTQFNLTVTPDGDGGQIILDFNLASDDCPPNFLQVVIDVPDCQPCDGDNEIYIYEDDLRLPPACMCTYLCLDHPVHVFVCGAGLTQGRYPILTITSGCMTDDCTEECTPAEFLFSNTGWTLWGDSCWHNVIIPASEGCVCVCFDRYLPAELNGFTATGRDGEVQLDWSTASETSNDHFEVLRDGLLAGTVAATNNAAGATYSFVDRGLANGRLYRYELAAVSLTGEREIIGQREAAPEAGAAIVTELSLGQNYPNPFNPETSISFDLVDDSHVSLEVFNAVGQRVSTLVNGAMQSGRHSVLFRADALPSGLYFYRLTVGATTLQKKMLLLK